MLTILHGQYEKLTRRQLHDVPVTPRGNRSTRWLGLQHGEFIERIIELFASEFDIVPHNEIYAVSPNQAVLIGGFELARPNKKGEPTLMTAPDSPHSMAYSFGARHSNDSRFAISCVSGARVMICENGCAFGEEKWKHKHTSGFRLRDFLLNGLRRFLDKLGMINRFSSLLGQTEIDNDQFDTLLLALGRSNIVPWRYIGEVDSHWLNPTLNPNFCGNTLWDWYNTVTHVCKKLSVMDQYSSLQKAFHLATSFLPETARKELALPATL